ncbi:hypothetical protein BG58_31420 [Caballeronia jiangsuensis]|nr:hypothetical protein BG58_31420 [Caballeronia jiangsuensis]
MKEISLTRGRVALVDDSDFDYLSQYTWYAQLDRRKTVDEVWYACRYFLDASGKRRGIQMQRDLMRPADGFVVCFRNHNGLDVRRENLIVTTRSADLSRRRLKERSLPRGVKVRAQGRFEARILNGTFVGTFDTPEEASNAYQAARHRFGLDVALPREEK